MRGVCLHHIKVFCCRCRESLHAKIARRLQLNFCFDPKIFSCTFQISERGLLLLTCVRFIFTSTRLPAGRVDDVHLMHPSSRSIKGNRVPVTPNQVVRDSRSRPKLTSDSLSRFQHTITRGRCTHKGKFTVSDHLHLVTRASQILLNLALRADRLSTPHPHKRASMQSPSRTVQAL